MTLFRKLFSMKLPILAVIGFAFALSSVLLRPQQPEAKPVMPPPQSPYDATLAGLGVVEPKSEIISVASDLPGVISQVFVHVDDMVEAGAPLFSLDQRDIDALIKSAQASLASAKIRAAEADALYMLVKNIGDNRAVAKDDYNRRKYNAQLAAAAVAEAEAMLTQHLTTKERLTVRAPISGRILSLDARVGEYATPQYSGTPLVRMGDISRLHVRVEFDEEMIASVKPHNSGTAYIRGDSGTAYALDFIRFEPYIRPKQNLAMAGQRVDTRVMQAIYAIQNPSDDLRIGQQMDVFLNTQKGQ